MRHLFSKHCATEILLFINLTSRTHQARWILTFMFSQGYSLRGVGYAYVHLTKESNPNLTLESVKIAFYLEMAM